MDFSFPQFTDKKVCLYYLNDPENAQVSFRKSILSSSAIKNPLIYLNYAIFCLECMKDPSECSQYLNNFYNLCDTMRVPSEARFTDRGRAFKIYRIFIRSTSRLQSWCWQNYHRPCSYPRRGQQFKKSRKPKSQLLMPLTTQAAMKLSLKLPPRVTWFESVV